MRIGKILALGLLVACAALAAPEQVVAENIEITPLAWDYGEVEVGESSTQVVTLMSTGPTPLSIYTVEISDDATGFFTMLLDFHPVNLLEGESLEVPIEYAPMSPGDHSAFLNVFSNATPPDHYVNVALSGFATDAAADPGELMSDVLDFADAAEADGRLEGAGPDWGACWRLRLFGFLLDWAASLIEAEQDQMACWALDLSLKLADGEQPLRDWVTGPATEELADMLWNVGDVLGCD